MASIDQREKAIKYKYDAEWNGHDGWHFAFGTKRLWEIRTGFVVADLKQKDGREQFCDHERFAEEELIDALKYMRLGKR